LENSSVLGALVGDLPISSGRLARIKVALFEDEVGVVLLQYITEGWLNIKLVPAAIKPFYTFREFMTQVGGLIYYMDRVFISEPERDPVLKDIHKGHQGETTCISRASEIIWWPGMTAQIKQLVQQCRQCEEHRIKHREPLQTTVFPERLWWRLAVDLFNWQENFFVIVVDYYSRYIVVRELEDSSESTVLTKILNELICMLGVPNTIVSDNGATISVTDIPGIFEKMGHSTHYKLSSSSTK